MAIAFPEDFVWGVSTSAHQIEGAPAEDGKGPSAWDVFSHRKGKTEGGGTGDVACDHYHLWRDDLDLMADLGLRAYRFSVSWPRIFPEGDGKLNEKGLDFYDRLVDGVLERGMEPYVNLFHYDTPQSLEDRFGGWAGRETADAFGDYANAVSERLGDRVTWWLTQNEPQVLATAGYLLGFHAPGRRNPAGFLRATHNMLVGNGKAVQGIRASSEKDAKIGAALNYTPFYADFPAAGPFAEFSHACNNRLFFDPLLLGRYPAPFDRLMEKFVPGSLDDLGLISAPMDWLGVNYYSVGRVPFRSLRPGAERSEMKWEICPEGLHDSLVRINRDYAPKELLVTENGICVPDELGPDGMVHDGRRIRYLRDHIAETHRAMEAGVPVKGFFVWSFLDNFEWAFGYRPRFGMVYVDYPTQGRIVKDSGRWYSQVIKDNGFP